MKSEFEEVLNRKIEGMKDKTIADALVEKVMKMALDGDRQMIKLIWEMVDGKPATPRMELPPERIPKRVLSQEEIDRVDALFAKNDEQL